jgi:phosphoglycolate phosphatase-like HAD superfamily hydrolase
MKSASAAGIRGIGVLSGGFEEAQLRSAGASAIYRDPRHLAAHVPDWLATA